MSAADMMTPDPQPKLSEAERILNTYTAPTKTFEDLKRNAMFIAPILLMLVCGTLFSWTVGKRVGWEMVMQNNMKMAPAAQQERMEQIPAEQKPRVMAQQLKFTQIISYAFPFIGLIILTVVSLVLWATFTFAVGKEITFGKSMAIVIYASLPGVLKALLATLMLWLKVPEDFFIQNPIGTNIGHFLDINDTPRFLYSVATSLDLFMIWTLVLTAIGFSVIANVKRGTAYAVVFGWWGAVSLISAALAAAFA
jgi:hypothetical protein